MSNRGSREQAPSGGPTNGHSGPGNEGNPIQPACASAPMTRRSWEVVGTLKGLNGGLETPTAYTNGAFQQISNMINSVHWCYDRADREAVKGWLVRAKWGAYENVAI